VFCRKENSFGVKDKQATFQAALKLARSKKLLFWQIQGASGRGSEGDHGAFGFFVQIPGCHRAA
jgi:hypothetical protein